MRNPAARRRALFRARHAFQPPHVRLLIVGESPPASGRHFYAADSGLFRATRAAFERACPALRDRDDFLAAFRDLGCSLTDLSDRAVDRLSAAARRAACRASEPRLAREIAALDPRVMVTVVRSIEPNVRRAMARAGWKGEWLALPYPGRWARSRAEFESKLAAGLERWLRAGWLGAPARR